MTLTAPPDTTAMLPTLADIRTVALNRLDPAISDFLEGGAGAERTLRENSAAFDRITLVPQLMSGREHPRLNTSFLGIPLSMPVLTAPFGADGYFHPDGQVAVARANAHAGIASIVPEASTHSLEDHIAAAADAALIGQLHPMGTEENFVSLIKRYRDAGYRALCITLDSPTIGWRERNLRSGFVIDNSVVGGNYPPGSEVDMERALGQLYPHNDPIWSWTKLRDLVADGGLPWIAKGVLSPRDAELAVDAGAAAILVSNHGGRQLDDVPSSIEALPDIASAVGGDVAIALDSGVRRGSDIVKALALGADVVVVGRLIAYGLAAGGEQGVSRVLDLLRGELETTMALLGRGDVTDLDPTAVTRKATA